MNRDGLPDVVTGWEEAGIIRVYLHPGMAQSKQAWPAVTVGKVGSPEDAVFADLDRDGGLDVVSSCEGQTRTMHVHWAPHFAGSLREANHWRTESIPVTAGQQMWMFALPLQVDGQGGLDLVVGSKGAGAGISWLRSPERPRDVAAWTLHRIRDAGWIMSLLAGDMDGDGDADVIASDRKGPGRGVFWLENPGPAEAAQDRLWKEHHIGAAGHEVMFLDFAALSGDGRKEVVAAVKPGKLFVFEEPAAPDKPWIGRSVDLPTGVGTAKAVRVADIDLDGKADLVFTCEDAVPPRSGVGWLQAVSSGTNVTWRFHDVSGPEGIKYDLIEPVDLDADGDLDLLTCEERANLGVIWYENPVRSSDASVVPRVMMPEIVGDWWTVAGDPDLGAYTDPQQQPVDFGVWQAADGTWQLWSCIRKTKCGGNTRLFHRWEGRQLTASDWKPMGIAMEAVTEFGETPGGLQAPFVIQDRGTWLMFYGDWERICVATSQDGKTFTRRLSDDGKAGLFGEGPGSNARDPMVLRIDGLWHCYYTAHPNRRGAVYARTSPDTFRWSEARLVAFGGAAGTNFTSAECPFVVEWAPGEFYLFRTQRYGANAITRVYYSRDPMDFGVNQDEGHLIGTLPVAAPEVFRHDDKWFIASLLPSLKGIRVARLGWRPKE